MTAPHLQSAALPYRWTGDRLELLLVTSLGTRRWIVPKGWPMEGEGLPEAAAREALEEAGVVGEIGREAIGSFRYDKRRKRGAPVPCTVQVFALAVTEESADWPERGRRQLRWLPPEEAAGIVSDPGLGDLIRAWAGRLHGRPARSAPEVY